MIGCRFISLNDGVDIIRNDNDIMPFRNLFNEFQSRDPSKKITAVKQANAKMGNYLGCYVPYGYKAHPDNKHNFVIDEVAAGVVRKIFANRRKGWGYRKIAAKLNEEHILSPLDYYSGFCRFVLYIVSMHLERSVLPYRSDTESNRRPRVPCRMSAQYVRRGSLHG